MKAAWFLGLGVLAVATLALLSFAGGDESNSAAASLPAAERRSLEEARREARLLHAAMHSALQAVHHRYYREDEGLVIPAAMFKEVFAEVEKDQQVKLRWLAVEGQAMNSDHEAQTPFAIEAVKALKSGKREFEQSAGGVYQRAGAITLTSHCLKCHVPDRKSTKDRTAGLIITIPVKEQ